MASTTVFAAAIFTPAEIADMAKQASLRVLISCAWFDSALAPSKEHLRMQLLLERL